MIIDVMNQRSKLTGEQLFDWGLQVIIDGLRSSINCPGLSEKK
jgi:hypothetical protein